MALVRVTFFCKDSNGYGWTETIYSTSPNLTAAIGDANKLYPLRTPLFGNNSYLSEIRLSDDLIKRDSQIIVVPPPVVRSGGQNFSNLANDDAVLRIEGNNNALAAFTVRRTLALRGTPISVTGAAGAYNPEGNEQWNKDFLAYAAALVGPTWAVRARNSTVSTFLIQTVVQTPGSGLVTITTGVAHGFVPNDQVLIAGQPAPKQINGLQRVLTVPTLTSFTINIQTVLGAQLGQGQVGKNPYLLCPISKVLLIRMSGHKAGRPFDAPRGRRRARARS